MGSGTLCNHLQMSCVYPQKFYSLLLLTFYPASYLYDRVVSEAFVSPLKLFLVIYI